MKIKSAVFGFDLADSTLQKPAREELRKDIAALTTVGVAFLVLLIGLPFGDDRLRLSGVRFAPILSIMVTVAILTSGHVRNALRSVIIAVLPLAICSITLFWSSRPDYGAFKLFNLLGVSALSVPLLLACARARGSISLARAWVLLMAALLAVTLLYKARFGFFDRQVLFFLNGPIVFGRLMGLAAILSLVAFPRKTALLGFFVFSVAVIWTMSKGPLLALLAATAFAVFFVLDQRTRRAFVLITILLSLIVIFFAWDFVEAMNWSRLAALASLLESGAARGTVEFGSVGARLLVFAETPAIIASNFFGVGLGGWSNAIPENLGLDYPHNILLELWSENGILLGSIGLLPFVLFFSRMSGSVFAPACLFLLAAQMVSGDLLDARYLLAFSLLCFYDPKCRNTVESH